MALIEAGMAIKLQLDIVPVYLSFVGVIKSVEEDTFLVEIDGEYAQGTSYEVKCVIPKETKALHFKSTIVRGELNQLIIKIPDEANVEEVQRRKYVRVPVEIPVHCYLVGIGEKQVNSSKFFPGTIKDISGGGVLINAPISLPLDTVIVFELTLENHSMVLTAKVVRNHGLSDGSRDLGCAFLGLDEQDLQRIMSYCSRLQLQAKKNKA